MSDKTVPVAYDPAAALMEPSSFDQLYRVGKMLAHSALFPEHLRKGSPEQAAANGALVMNMAVRLREDPLTVAQNIYFVGGKPSFSTQYMIAKANQHGVFQDQIGWEITGEGDDLSVTAFAVMAKTGARVQMTCDMEMARAEGWTKNPKYKSMPEVMLRYRSAAFLIRMYCPEVMIGIPMQVEVELAAEEIRDITPPAERPKAAKAAPAQKPKPVPDAEVADPKPEPEDSEADEGEVTEDGEVPKDAAAPVGPSEADIARMRNLANAIMADLSETSQPSLVLDFYKTNLEEMKELTPDIYQDVMVEAKKREQSDD
jgi:hypothetical protein